jgi:hypothetical protein
VSLIRVRTREYNRRHSFEVHLSPVPARARARVRACVHACACRYSFGGATGLDLRGLWGAIMQDVSGYKGDAELELLAETFMPASWCT